MRCAESSNSIKSCPLALHEEIDLERLLGKKKFVNILKGEKTSPLTFSSYDITSRHCSWVHRKKISCNNVSGRERNNERRHFSNKYKLFCESYILLDFRKYFKKVMTFFCIKIKKEKSIFFLKTHHLIF